MRIEEFELGPDSVFYLVDVDGGGWYCQRRERDGARCLFVFTDPIMMTNCFSSFSTPPGKELTASNPIPVRDFAGMLGEMRSTVQWVAIDAIDKDKFSAIAIDDFMSLLYRHLSCPGDG